MSSAHLQSGGGFFVSAGGVARLVGCNTFGNEATNVCDRHSNLPGLCLTALTVALEHLLAVRVAAFTFARLTSGCGCLRVWQSWSAALPLRTRLITCLIAMRTFPSLCLSALTVALERLLAVRVAAFRFTVMRP